MVKKTKLFGLPKFGSLEDWRNFGNLQKIGKFLELGVALILRYLLTDLLLVKTKLALVRPGPYKHFLLTETEQLKYI